MSHDQRLRHDARLFASEPEALALLECLAQHLFDPALDTTFMGRVCGAPRVVRDRVAEKLGPLKTYVTKLRMAEAARQVRETKVPIKEIGRRVGYPVPRTFRRRFAEIHGTTPQEMRQKARVAGDAGGDATSEQTPGEDGKRVAPRPRDDETLSRRALIERMKRRLELGMLDPRRASELRLDLRRRHPRLDQQEAAAREAAARKAATREPQAAGSPQEGPQGRREWPVMLTPTGDWIEEIAATSAFGHILELPEEDQRFALLQGLLLGNITAFYRLYEFCEALVRQDIDGALRLARLGVELIETHSELMVGEADHWQARAWVGLARIQVIAGDPGGAERSLGFAAAEVGGEDKLPPWVEIEARWVEGWARQLQRRYDDAARALDRAVELGRELPEDHRDRSLSVLRRLELAGAVGDADACFAGITELEGLIPKKPVGLGGERPTALHGLIFLYGAKAYAAEGRPCCAERCLRQAMEDIIADPACDTQKDIGILFTHVIHELARLLADDGRLEDCEQFLRHSIDRFRRFEMPVLEATAEAELAAVCALRGRHAEARELAASAADFLGDLPDLHREAWTATRRLRQLANGGAAATESEIRELLGELRRDLDLVTWEITGPQARSAARSRWQRAEAP